MPNTIQTIPLINLALAFIPVLATIAILFRWSLNSGTALYAVARMLVQLLLIGYVLTYIFESDSAWVVIAVLSVMLFVASWIALRPIHENRQQLYAKALLAIAAGGVSTLIIMVVSVLDLPIWYEPRFVIPLAGMIFSNSMNTVSLAGERFQAEFARGAGYNEARRAALNAALIPMINSLFAVGLVSLPGMMTGQILSGIEPLVAVRYQIMVMCMVFGSGGIAAACFLVQLRPK